MAEPLKNQFGAEIPRRLAAEIAAVWPTFPSRAFLREVLAGYEALELMDRGRHIALVLSRYLPGEYPAAIDILLRSLVSRQGRTDSGGMASFYYLPHVCFVAAFGLEHFDVSMGALYQLTQRFTAEFSIRPFIERDEAKVLGVLAAWARDPNPHVRRLVSEGTRPRLPWAGRLRRFQEDPAPVLALLELLKDDPALYVRRSVANNLNDIGRDHPDRLVETAGAWWVGAGAERKTLIRHALRSLVKAGHPGALETLGFGADAEVAIERVAITPKRVARGDKVSVAFAVRSLSRRPQRVLVDFRIHFVKASGRTSPKVFKLKAAHLNGGDVVLFRKTVTLADLTTRQHYPGRHDVDALVNGRIVAIGAFSVVAKVRTG